MLMRFSETTTWDNAIRIPLGSEAEQLRKLNVPYADELMAGISQNLYDFLLSVKYIHRFGRDEVRRTCESRATFAPCSIADTDTTYVYKNSGRSESDIVTISLQNSKPFEIPLGFSTLSKAYFLPLITPILGAIMRTLAQILK